MKISISNHALPGDLVLYEDVSVDPVFATIDLVVAREAAGWAHSVVVPGNSVYCPDPYGRFMYDEKARVLVRPVV